MAYGKWKQSLFPYTKNKKETVDISWSHNENGLIGEIGTHRTYQIKRREESIGLAALCYQIVEQVTAFWTKGNALLRVIRDITLQRAMITHNLKGNGT